jgi:hypothetical protein
MPLVGGWPGSAGQILWRMRLRLRAGFGEVKFKVPTSRKKREKWGTRARRVGHRGQRRRTGMSLRLRSGQADPHGQSAGVASAIW